MVGSKFGLCWDLKFKRVYTSIVISCDVKTAYPWLVASVKWNSFSQKQLLHFDRTHFGLSIYVIQRGQNLWHIEMQIWTSQHNLRCLWHRLCVFACKSNSRVKFITLLSWLLLLQLMAFAFQMPKIISSQWILLPCCFSFGIVVSISELTHTSMCTRMWYIFVCSIFVYSQFISRAHKCDHILCELSIYHCCTPSAHTPTQTHSIMLMLFTPNATSLSLAPSCRFDWPF